jgi:hypothetical protein
MTSYYSLAIQCEGKGFVQNEDVANGDEGRILILGAKG